MSEARDDLDATAPITTSPQAAQTELKPADATSSEDSLRQRKFPADTKPRASEVATAAAVRPRGTEGVPIQIAAILCLVSFLLAYFLF